MLFFGKMHRDVFLNVVFPYLSLKEFTQLRQLNKAHKEFLSHPNIVSMYWQKKMERYFPSYIKLNTTKCNWDVFFRKTYNALFPSLSPESRKWISLLLDGDFKEFQQFKLRPSLLETTDKKEKSFLSYAQDIKDPKKLDHIYNSMITQEHTPERKLYWAIVCLRPAQSIVPLLEGMLETRLDKINLPLHLAAAAGSLPLVKFILLQNSTLLNHHNGYLHTALSLAAQRGHYPIVEFLLTRPEIDIEQSGYSSDGGCKTALYYAAMGGHTQIVALLIKAGARILPREGSSPTLLYYAVRERHLDVVRLLLEKETTLLNMKDESYPPLVYAVQNNDLPMAKLLISKGACVDHIMLDSKTLLYVAVEKCFEEMAVLLIQANANPECSFFTPLIHRATELGQVRIVKALLVHYPHMINLKDKHGQTPLIWAASKGHLAILDYLLTQVSIDLKACTLAPTKAEHGMTALHWAARNGFDRVVAKLLKAGAPITEKELEISNLATETIALYESIRTEMRTESCPSPRLKRTKHF